MTVKKEDDQGRLTVTVKKEVDREGHTETEENRDRHTETEENRDGDTMTVKTEEDQDGDTMTVKTDGDTVTIHPETGESQNDIMKMMTTFINIHMVPKNHVSEKDSVNNKYASTLDKKSANSNSGLNHRHNRFRFF